MVLWLWISEEALLYSNMALLTDITPTLESQKQKYDVNRPTPTFQVLKMKKQFKQPVVTFNNPAVYASPGKIWIPWVALNVQTAGLRNMDWFISCFWLNIEKWNVFRASCQTTMSFQNYKNLWVLWLTETMTYFVTLQVLLHFHKNSRQVVQNVFSTF